MDELEAHELGGEKSSGIIAYFQQRPGLTAALLLLLLATLFLGNVLLPAEGEVLGGHDMRGYYYPYYDQVREAVRDGRLPFWEPTLFNGFPLMAQPQQNAFYPPLWPSFLIPSVRRSSRITSKLVMPEGLSITMKPLGPRFLLISGGLPFAVVRR